MRLLLILICVESSWFVRGAEHHNMAEVLVLEEDVKNEESSASVKSDPEEAAEEAPNGVKTWVHLLQPSGSRC